MLWRKWLHVHSGSGTSSLHLPPLTKIKYSSDEEEGYVLSGSVKDRGNTHAFNNHKPSVMCIFSRLSIQRGILTTGPL